jgi:hypothetical protein
MSYGIKTNYLLSTPVSPVDLNRRGDVLQAQLPGALRAAGGRPGVLPPVDYDFSAAPPILDLTVDDDTVTAGAALINSETAGAFIFVSVPEPGLLIPDRGDGLYLHLALRLVADGSIGGPSDTKGTDSRRGAVPVLLISEDADETDALLLAAWNDVDEKWDDAREFVSVAALALALTQIQSDLGYDEDQRAKGTVAARLDGLEDTGTEPGGDDVSLQIQVNALKLTVNDLLRRVGILEAASGEGAELFPQPFDTLSDNLMLVAATTFELSPHGVERPQMAIVGQNFGHAQNSTPDFTPDTGDVRELPFDPATGLFGT